MKIFLVILCLGTVYAGVDATNVTPSSSPKNCSSQKLNFECISSSLQKEQSSIWQLLGVTAASGIWILYLAFYNSRLFGLLMTKIINYFYKDAYIHLGSISISVLGGKLMFRDVLYVTTDYSLRIHDGYAIFRWWRPYDFKSFMKRKDLDQGHTRLSVYISSFDYHVYNRTKVYEQLNELFGLKSSTEFTKEDVKKVEVESEDKIPLWRTLMPVIKFNISSGRLTFGNRLMPTTLGVSFSDGEVQYKTAKASNEFDLFMHVVEGQFGSFRVMLSPSVGYNPSATPAMLKVLRSHNEPPPRKMGSSGYAILQSHDVQMSYVWDEPGKVPLDPGEEKRPLHYDHDEDESPLWELTMTYGKRTTISYGPWADRQRELLWKFFFPPDYQRLKVAEKPAPGQRREPEMFRFSANVLHNADIDILFTKNEKVSALQMNILKGSSVEVEIPTIVKDDGYTTLVSGRLFFMNTTTNLPFQNILKAETLSFKVTSHYPLWWNASQTWNCDITATEASLTLLFAHKNLISDLMDDWSNKAPPDLMSFVPYTFSFRICLHDFEIILPCNAHNWIDCFSGTRAKENAYVGLHGNSLEIKFVLPFDDFLPPTFSIPFTFDLHHGELCIFLPESNPSRNVLLSLSSNLTQWNNVQENASGSVFRASSGTSSSTFDPSIGKSKKWGGINDEWVKCWSVPSLFLTLSYTWHPVVASHGKSPPKSSVTTDAKHVGKGESPSGSAENLHRRHGGSKSRAKSAVTFDPTSLEADELRMTLKITSSTLFLYGSLLDSLVAVKENYFGYDDICTRMSDGTNMMSQRDIIEQESCEENPDAFRPLQVILDVELSEVKGVLPVYPNPVSGEPPCVVLNRLTFELDKNYHQTRLQLLLTDLAVDVTDRLKRSEPDVTMETRHGRVHLADLQLRGHAMFSGKGLPIGATCIEYAWLTEALVGPIKAKLSVPQVQILSKWAETFVFLLKNEDQQLKPAFPNRMLPTGIPWNYRKKDGSDLSETDVKYLMTRLRLEDVRARLVEGSSVIDVFVAPVTVANGNVQDKGILEAVSVVADSVKVKQRFAKGNSSREWLEVGEVCFGPLISQINVATDEYQLSSFQEEFLKFHDRKTRRLDFLWESTSKSASKKANTGVGTLLGNVRGMKSWGCAFFTPLTSQHPTFYYAKQRTLSSRTRQDSNQQLRDSNEEFLDGNTADTDEEVFNSELDFGMSLLVPGKRLLTRISRSFVTSTSDDEVDAGITVTKQTSPDKPAAQVQSSVQGTEEKGAKAKVPAGQVLLSAAFAPKPDVVAIPEEDEEEPVLRKAIRARSTESNLYCSAESELSSRSSEDSFFSAESDVNEGDPGSDADHEEDVGNFSGSGSATPSIPGTHADSTDHPGPSSVLVEPFKATESSSKDPSIVDPTAVTGGASGTGGGASGTGGDVSGTGGGQAIGDLPSEATEPLGDLSFESVSSRPGYLALSRRKSENEPSGAKIPDRHYPLGRRMSLISSHQLVSCYEDVLPSSTVKSAVNEEFLPEFEELNKGIHPSVIVGNSGQEKLLRKRHSVDILNQDDEEKSKSTNVKVHIKNELQVQLSPFLLETAKQVVDAAYRAVAWQPPLQILADLRKKCACDARNMHRVEVAKAKKETNEGKKEIAPGFQIHFAIDSINVNVVQATTGGDSVFNLKLNKLLPTPSICILSLRLSEVDFCYELNIKHNKLLSKILTKQRKISTVSNKSAAALDKTLQAWKDSTPAANNPSVSNQPVMFDFIGHVSMKSLDAQLRVMSENGILPERTCVTALVDDACKAGFRFDDKTLLPKVADSIDRFEGRPSLGGRRAAPPKPWGWVTVEFGCQQVVADIVKQMQTEDLVANEEAGAANAEEGAERANTQPDDPHVCNGTLEVGVVWLNGVSPPSSSQALKSSRTVRTWNLLTSLAPSVSAWLDPANQLNTSIKRLEKRSLVRKSATVCAAMVVALETLMSQPEMARKLWGGKMHKFDILTDLSKSIRQDASFRLCDVTLQLFLDGERAHNLIAALADPEDTPPIVSLEKGFQILTVVWNEFVESLSTEVTRKSSKKVSSQRRPSFGFNGAGVTYGGNLDLGVAMKLQSGSPSSVPPSTGIPPEERNGEETPQASGLQQPASVKLQGSPLQQHLQERVRTPSAVQDVVYKQQQSMYSWMQSELSDVEAQNENAVLTDAKHHLAGSVANFITASDMNFSAGKCQQAQDMFDNFINHIGIRLVTDNKPSTSLVQKHCGGNLKIRLHLKTLKIDKQKPDPLYTKETLFPRRRRSTFSSRHSVHRRRHVAGGQDPPILLTQGLKFGATLIDSVIDEKKEVTDGDENSGKNGKKKSKFQGSNKNNNKNIGLLESSSWKAEAKSKSTLSVKLNLSLKHVTQRVDIALVRLIHQFIQCSDAIQQAQTDILVNRYTEGSVSPDPMLTHKRTISNVTNMSGHSFSSEAAARPTMFRRHLSHTSSARRYNSLFADVESGSSSSESEALAYSWQILYKIIDLHSARAGFSALRSSSFNDADEFRMVDETGRGVEPPSIPRRSSSFIQQPYLSLAASAKLTVAKIQFLAEFGQLKLSTLVNELSVSGSHSQTSAVPLKQAKSDVDAEIVKIEADITEHAGNVKKTIVTCEVASSKLKAATCHKRDCDESNTCTLAIGLIIVDLPQHPSSLHDVVSRGTRQLSTHMEEFAKTPIYRSSFDVVDGMPSVYPTETLSAATTVPATPMTPSAITAIIDLSQDSSDVTELPVVLRVSLTLQGINATVNLLPSLKATYSTSDAIRGEGRTGPDADFYVDLLDHSLQFSSEASDEPGVGPVSTAIPLPPIRGSGELRISPLDYSPPRGCSRVPDEKFSVKDEEYLAVSVKVGGFDHILTTDLFNQLVFFHEVFMNEVTDVIKKISRDENATSQLSETSLRSRSSSRVASPILYELQIQLQGICVTATTPSSTAVRLKTGTINFEISNLAMRAEPPGKKRNIPTYLRMFGKASVELSLALGSLVPNSVYPEAEAEFQQMSYFTTSLRLQNTSQQSRDTASFASGAGLAPSTSNWGSAEPPLQDNNVVLISLTRPLVFIQPTAFDKAILIFLAYKHAYEDWTEKRDHYEGVRKATKQVLSAIQARRSGSATSQSILFLQLSVDELGICMPTVQDANQYDLSIQDELSSALVLTVNNTQVDACYAKSLVTKGQFGGFCIRFADDFQISWDDWRPTPEPLVLGPGHKTQVVMNSIIVPQGTYQICSDTSSKQGQTAANLIARTCVDVRWEMDGMDVQLDTNIGAYLARLADTLTLIAGQDDLLTRESSASGKFNQGSRSNSLADLGENLGNDVVDGPSRDVRSQSQPETTQQRETSLKDKTKQIEQEINKQVLIINDLRTLRAKPTLIEEQEHKLHSLEASLSTLFRQTFRRRLRKSGSKQQESSRLPRHQRSLSHGVQLRDSGPLKSTQSAYATLPVSMASRDQLWTGSSGHSSHPSPQPLSIAEELDSDAFEDEDSGEGGNDAVDGTEPQVRRSLYLDESLNNPQGKGSFLLSQMAGHEIEAELELVLDVRVEISGGKIICHPQTPPATVNIPSKHSFIRQMEMNRATTFYVPGVDVKLHYNSATQMSGQPDVRFRELFTPPDSPQTSPSHAMPDIEVNTPGGTQAFKTKPGEARESRACVYTWLLIQSLPEMIISPYFLDFLEQTLTAIPDTPSTSARESVRTSNTIAFDSLSDDDNDDGPSDNRDPPVSAPSVGTFNTTIASLPVDVVVFVHVHPSQVLFNCQPLSRVECLLHIPSLDLVFSSVRDSPPNPSASAFSFPERATSTGLSFTAIMSDFSIYVFHPYGTQPGGLDECEAPTRNDSLSVNLKVVKVNIVRTRKENPFVAMETDSVSSSSDNSNSMQINLSILVDMDKASFKYDMRRLSEILAFPRAWYRKSIVRRLFLGDTHNDSTHNHSTQKSKPFNSGSSKSKHTPRSEVEIFNLFQHESPSTPKQPLNQKLTDPSAAENSPNPPLPSSWRGVVLFGLNMTRLDVEMNMSNVMGHTLWSCDGLKSDGKLSFNSNGDKDVFLFCCLENSHLSAKSGIIGGSIELKNLQANCHLLDPGNSAPMHNISVKVQSLDGRIEYMGGCVMIGRLTSSVLTLGDEWKEPKLSGSGSPSKRPVSVFVPGDMSWDTFYLIISRSTTPDVVKMLAKLEEFFSLQLRNSVRAFATLGQSIHSDVMLRRHPAVTQAPQFYHRRHWPPVFAAISDAFRSLGVALTPQFHLGGSFCLHGNELTVVCFHGANFRSRSWVLFNIREPNIVFSTEVQEIKESLAGTESSTLTIQSLTFNLGHDHLLKTGGPSTDPMATVSRVTTSQQNPPPSAAPIDEWFAYVTASRPQELKMLRTLNDISVSEDDRSLSASSNRRRVSSINQSAAYHHDTDIIFALPKLQLDFKTEHLQGPEEPNPDDESSYPQVDCSFVTEFTDHICVTMDVELIMFLHDLISSYLKEKQQSLSSRSRLSSISSAHSGVLSHDHVTSTVDPIDLRRFVCNTWQLEPTVRLISWAGRRIEPVGVDYVLQKLGFKHARTTIPKWFQRGVLDVLDQTLALIVQNLVIHVTNQKHKK